MGLGAYLAAVTDRDLYDSEERREREEVRTKPEAEKEEIYEVFEEYEIGRKDCATVVQALERSPENWVKVCMKSRSLLGDSLLGGRDGLIRKAVHDDL